METYCKLLASCVSSLWFPRRNLYSLFV